MRPFIWLFAFLVVGCFTNPKEKTKTTVNPNDSTVDVSGKKKNGLVKSYHADGKLFSTINYKDGVKHGISHSYYANGKVNLEMTYENGKRSGQSKRYYENGKLYQTTEYANNIPHGYQKKYREDGKPMSEARFESDQPCLGLKEYLLDNTLKKNYPTIVVTPVDELAMKGKYTLKIRMSDKTKKVKFYEGKLSASGCLHDKLSYIRLDERTGTGELVYTVPPGAFIMEELNLIARFKTTQGNVYITQRTYNLAIDN